MSKGNATESASPEPANSELAGPEVVVHRVAKVAALALDYLWVFWWQLRVFFSLGRWRRVPERYRHGLLAPIVLLPGVYETWHFLRPIADQLNVRGHPVHVVATLGYNRLSIPDSATAVARYLAENGLRNVTLVAHSKGGLIGKHLMTINDPEARVSRLVAVNTPFSGSAYARWVPLRTVRAFAPTEPTLKMLNVRQERNLVITSIYARFDPHIPEGSAIVGARNVPLPLMGHFRLLSQQLLIETVVEEAERDSGGDRRDQEM